MRRKLSERDALLAMAQVVRARLDHAVERLDEDGDRVDPVAASFVRDMHKAVTASMSPTGDATGWQFFVAAIETETHVASKVDVVDRVLARYADTFPHHAARLERSKVKTAIQAWGDDKKYWTAIHEALVDLAPDVANRNSMRRMWSKLTKDRPDLAPSKRRPFRAAVRRKSDK